MLNSREKHLISEKKDNNGLLPLEVEIKKTIVSLAESNAIFMDRAKVANESNMRKLIQNLISLIKNQLEIADFNAPKVIAMAIDEIQATCNEKIKATTLEMLETVQDSFTENPTEA